MGLSRGSQAFLAVLALLLVATVAALSLVNAAGSADEGEARMVTVEIPHGAGSAEVADLLAEHEVIGSSLAFRFAARLDERGSRIKAGTYQLRTGMETDQVLAVLSEGPPRPEVFTVTIPEGLTVDQTLRRLARADGSPFTVRELRRALRNVELPQWVPTAEELPDGASRLEGMLFPSTYEFRVDARPAAVLARLVEQTERVLDGVEPPRGLDRYDVLVMASLIEREARLAGEQPRISSVMHNRLDEPMPLQIDATVVYAFARRGEDKQRLLNRDYGIDSPWNTYQIQGLPPTPISGAGESAIRAAAEPADEDFLYYVVVDPETGEHGFSRTYAEHQRTIAEARADD